MTDTVVVALISSGSAVLVSITALILNYRGFASIDARFASLEQSINSRFTSLERRIERIEEDIKEWAKIFARIDTNITRLKDHTGLKP